MAKNTRDPAKRKVCYVPVDDDVEMPSEEDRKSSE